MLKFNIHLGHKMKSIPETHELYCLMECNMCDKDMEGIYYS